MNRPVLALLLCAACASPTAPSRQAPTEMQVQVVKLEYVGADDVAKALEKTLANQPTNNVSCKVVAHRDQNALVVAGTTAQIREVLETVARLDVPAGR